MQLARNRWLVFLWVLASCQLTPGRKETYPIQLHDLNEQPIAIKQYAGKTVFINIWATWCKPCIAEMPSIARAQELLKNEAVVFLLASNESAAETEEFRNNHNYPFTYVRVNNLEALGIQALPTTVLLNAEGHMIFSETGARKWDDPANLNLIRKLSKYEK